jgi:hypothetical protein
VHVQRALAASYTPAELAYALYGASLTATPAAAAPAAQQQPFGAAATAGAVDLSVGPSSSGSCDTTQQQQQPAASDADQQQQAQGLFAAEEPQEASFELTGTQYGAPFTINSIGEHTPASHDYNEYHESWAQHVQ